MNNTSQDGPLLSFRSMFSYLPSPTSMPQSEEQTNHLLRPAPSIQNRPASAQEPTDRILRNLHHHSISDASVFGSTDSSPTTTISTVDDSSATETSPSSSPESPPPNTFDIGMYRPRTADDSQPFFELQKQPLPRKGRNLKNLAVNTSRNPARGASSASLPLPIGNTDSLAPGLSSAFVKPYTPSKPRASNLGLTLVTPNKDKPPMQEIRLTIPPTPSFARPGASRQFQSSPTLPVFASNGSGDNYSYSNSDRTILDTIASATESEPPEAFRDESGLDYELPLSQEEKPEAYPDGPICVYEPYIDLYLEPTVDQAQEYDVIMNVASEVRNPFVEEDKSASGEPEIRIDGGGGIQYAPRRDRIPQRHTDTDGLIDTSPTTPKATPQEAEFAADDKTPRAQKDPEYIHIKWEHNSDIVPDLLDLVKLIDQKVMQGKRVLVHCQCGVSRSASLVVAYGLYKDPNLSVQEAYDEVKNRSKWIGPNMNLIMQLQEFRTSLKHGGLLPSNRGLTPITPASGLGDFRIPFSSSATAPNSSKTAAIPIIRAQAAEAMPVVISGPSSAPNDSTRPPTDQSTVQRQRAVSAAKSSTPWTSPGSVATPPVPVLKVFEPENQDLNREAVDSASANKTRQGSDSTTPTERKSSITEEEFAMTPLQPSPEVDPADSFGLMSPTSTEFSSSPFDRSALLARLGMGSVSQQEESVPRRSVSLRTKRTPQQSDGNGLLNEAKPNHSLRIKISSPDLREQQQLQDLQSRIDERQRSDFAVHPVDDDILLSPRATEFTQNPFALAISIPTTPPTSEAPASSDSDPRSPAQMGVSPITRNILDVL